LKRVFDCSRQIVRRALANKLEPPKRPGRDNALLDDAEVQIIAWIIRQAEKSQPVVVTGILLFSVESFGQWITREWVHSSLVTI
jgi:hypothetical protein